DIKSIYGSVDDSLPSSGSDEASLQLLYILVAVKTLLGLSLVADLIHCYMFTLLLIHSFQTQQGQAGWLLAVVVAVKSSLLNFCGAFI
ncbi:hypothetical protein Tco_0306037, partial [Tanacetum coccineum]